MFDKHGNGTEEPQITSISVANLRETVPLIFPMPAFSSSSPSLSLSLYIQPDQRKGGKTRSCCVSPTQCHSPSGTAPVNCDGERSGEETKPRGRCHWSVPVRPVIFTRPSSIPTRAVCCWGEQIYEEREREREKKRFVQTYAFRENVTRIVRKICQKKKEKGVKCLFSYNFVGSSR